MKTIKLIMIMLVGAISISSFTTNKSIQVESQNGKLKIYFTLRKNGKSHIGSYDGETFKYFTPKNGDSPRGENQASISPDGKTIAFNTYHYGGWKMGIANTNGTNMKQLAKSGNYNSSASFSKDGKWIIYAEKENGRTGTKDIYKIRTNGKDKKRLTRRSKNNYLPSFSPNGSKIVFVSPRDGGNYEIFVMNSDGSNQTNISKHPNHDSNPSWSPDGKQIAFMSIRGGFLNLFIMNADGSNLKNLTNDKNPFVATANSVDEMSYFYGTSWSPDGKSIVFVQNKDNKQKLYTINVDGSNLKQLIETEGEQFNPFWVE